MNSTPMLHTTALRRARAAGMRVCLASRPSGVLHLVELRKRPGGAVRRPVCGTRTLRLYVRGEAYSPQRLGRHESGRALCRRCSARIQACRSASPAAPAVRAEQPLDLEDSIAAMLAATDAEDYWTTLGAVLAARPRVPWTTPPPVGSRVPRLVLLDACWKARRDLGVGDDCRRTPLGRTVPGKRPLQPADRPRPVTNPPLLVVVAIAGALEHQGVDGDDAVRSMLGMSGVRYQQVLNSALDDPAAFLFDPPLVNRLRRVRDGLRRGRALPAAGATA